MGPLTQDEQISPAGAQHMPPETGSGRLETETDVKEAQVYVEAQEHQIFAAQDALNLAHAGNDTLISHRTARRDVEQDHLSPMV